MFWSHFWCWTCISTEGLCLGYLWTATSIALTSSGGLLPVWTPGLWNWRLSSSIFFVSLKCFCNLDHWFWSWRSVVNHETCWPMFLLHCGNIFCGLFRTTLLWTFSTSWTLLYELIDWCVWYRKIGYLRSCVCCFALDTLTFWCSHC